MLRWQRDPKGYHLWCQGVWGVAHRYHSRRWAAMVAGIIIGEFRSMSKAKAAVEAALLEDGAVTGHELVAMRARR